MCSRARSLPPLLVLNWPRVLQILFYSVQIATTLGASPLHPATTFAQVVLTLETVVGAILFTLAAGIIFARFSNPAVKIIFSRRAVIAPYKEGVGFMFRLVNGRSNELVDLTATLTMVTTDKSGKRSFHRLSLDRSTILVFPLSWTVIIASPRTARCST